ncbi:flocculation protein FLO11-like [Drosophila obscura]|uniref:flocculation protein FLO11-like n=1 Tax=Drosophila obscura TaxID=7282 RepID=UPI001BB19FE0|nr:flocculation protein FLO11-like [Drosophila obscura]
MPIVGQQYGNGFRPYSSFRVPRGSCSNNNSPNGQVAGSVGSSQPLSSNGANINTRVMVKSAPGAGAPAGPNRSKNTAASSSSSSSSIHQQGVAAAPASGGGNFVRQQPWRSSYCSISNNRHKVQQEGSCSNPSPHQQRLGVNSSTFKPLTPKLIRRIETTCSSATLRHGKARAPQPPSSAQQLPPPPRPGPTPSTARKQYQSAAVPSQMGTPTSQKRTHQTAGKSAKENCPGARLTQRSSKNYPAPQPPTATATAGRSRQTTNDLTAGRGAGGVVATPLSQRRQLPATPKLSFKQRNGCTTTSNGAGGGSSSTGSSDSHDSPRLKKAFSNKFPQGLPFEEEFYGSNRNRSYSQSSSNYSFYSSVGAATTPHDDDDDYGDGYEDVEDIHADEFQRKPATDESLYVDFSKLVQSRQQRQYVPASSWIRASPEHSSSSCKLTPAQQRRKSTKYARSMHEYLYSDDHQSVAQSKHRLSVVDEPEDGYYSYAAGTPEPETTSPSTPRTDIYVAAASWAPKPLYPDRVLLPSSDGKQQQSQKHMPQQAAAATATTAAPSVRALGVHDV